ncbi:MAG TPA: hypothetical protein VF104_04430, partial [Burkholderiales bacterium]
MAGDALGGDGGEAADGAPHVAGDGGLLGGDADLARPVGNFSGGEKARLVLAMLVWQRPNLL